MILDFMFDGHEKEHIKIVGGYARKRRMDMGVGLILTVEKTRVMPSKIVNEGERELK